MAVLHPREGVLWWGENFWVRLTTASMQCLRLSESFFHYVMFLTSAALNIIVWYFSCLLDVGVTEIFITFLTKAV